MPRSKIACAPSSLTGPGAPGVAPVLTVADASRLPIRSQTAMAIFVPPKSNPSTTGEFPTMACQFRKNVPASYRPSIT